MLKGGSRPNGGSKFKVQKVTGQRRFKVQMFNSLRSLKRNSFKTFKPFNRFAPFKPFRKLRFGGELPRFWNSGSMEMSGTSAVRRLQTSLGPGSQFSTSPAPVVGVERTWS